MHIKLALLTVAALLALAAAPETVCQTRKTSGANPKPRVRSAKSPEPAAPVVAAIVEDPPPPPLPPKPKISDAVIADVFDRAKVGSCGVAGISLPRGLQRENDWQMPHQNGDVSWTTRSRTWKSPVTGAEIAALDVELSVTVWNSADFSFVQDLRADLKTPENLLAIDLISEIKAANSGTSPVKEARRMEIGGVEGGFFRAELPSDRRRFLLGWFTYRIFDGKAQRISLTVTGRMDELPKALKIIDSLEFES